MSGSVIDNPFEPNVNRVFINAGMQNIGLWLQAQIAEADEQAMLRMMQENFDAAKRAASTELAARLPSGAE